MVSIIVPVYNVECYLNTCVESILKLKTEIEVILVDDGSKDKSGMLCDQWAKRDSRVNVIHQKNGGLSVARNTGIRNANGEYIMFVDSDDFINPEETDKMLFAQRLKPDCIIGLYRNFFEKENRFEKENSDCLLQMNGLRQVDIFLKNIPRDGQSCYMVAVRFVVRKDIMLKNSLFFLPGIYHEDEEWTQRLLVSINNVYVSNCFFYEYRIGREGSITSQVRSKNIYDRFNIMERLQKNILHIGLSEVKKAYLNDRLAQLYLSNMIDCRILKGTERKQVVKKLQCFEKEVSQYLSGYLGKSVAISQRIIGVSNTCYLIKCVYKCIKG